MYIVHIYITIIDSHAGCLAGLGSRKPVHAASTSPIDEWPSNTGTVSRDSVIVPSCPTIEISYCESKQNDLMIKFLAMGKTISEYAAFSTAFFKSYDPFTYIKTEITQLLIPMVCG